MAESKVLADVAAIFAGGEGSRFGGVDKGLIELGGVPLWRRVCERMAPQARMLAVVAPAKPDWIPADAIWLQDAGERRGPAGALLAGLRHAASIGPEATLLTAPVDAPFLPDDLGERLALARYKAPAAIAATEDGDQPVFGMWSASSLPEVEAVLHAGEQALHRLAAAVGAVSCEWLDAALFSNINTPEDLSRTEALLASRADFAPPPSSH